MNPYNLKVGDKLYYKTKDNRPQMGWTTITFVGRKYFQVDVVTGNCLLDEPFKSSKYIRLYPNEQSYLDELKQRQLTYIIQKYFSSLPTMPLEKLEQIVNIINGD